MVFAAAVKRPGSSAMIRRRSSSTTPYSSESAAVVSGTTPAFSNSKPLWIRRVASPPSSRIAVGPSSPGHVSAWSVHHQYSSRVSPFQAKTGMPLGSSGVPSGPTAMAAAAWSWVEKMLQLAQRTSAPRATRVSMRTAVWIVMCKLPVIRDPASGLDSPNSVRMAIRPGISCSARWISLRPNSARLRSATLKSGVVAGTGFSLVFVRGDASKLRCFGADICRGTPRESLGPRPQRAAQTLKRNSTTSPSAMT